MKKIIVLMTSLLLLTGCVKVSFTGPKKEEKTSQSTSSKKEPLTFVRADKYKDQENEVLEASEQFIKEHPTLGNAGKIFVFFPGYTFGNEENRFALFLMVNRTTTNIDRDASFVLNLEYDGAPLLENITVDYQINESGVLKPNMVSAIPVKITKEQEEKLNSMTDSSKAKMSFKDFKFKSN
jgi:lipoprotein